MQAVERTALQGCSYGYRQGNIKAQRVGFFQYRVGSGRVLDKIPGSGSGSGGVGVSKYTLGYFRVCRVFSGISGYVGYLRVLFVQCFFSYHF